MPDDQHTLSPLQFTPDHDVLIELRTEMRGMRGDLKSFSDDTRDRLARLEENKLDKAGFTDYQLQVKSSQDDHERRLRFLERWGWTIWGGLSLLEFGIVVYITFFHR